MIDNELTLAFHELGLNQSYKMAVRDGIVILCMEVARQLGTRRGQVSIWQVGTVRVRRDHALNTTEVHADGRLVMSSAYGCQFCERGPWVETVREALS